MGCAAKGPLRVHYSVICTHHCAACSLTTSLTAPRLSLYLWEVFVRSVARLCLVVLLMSGLLDLPAFAAAEKPLGMVIQAQDAQLDNAKLQVGTSVYRGDTLATDAGGQLRVKLRCTQLYLLADSTATLEQDAGTVHATV